MLYEVITLQSSRGNLVGEFRVGQQAAGHADKIRFTLSQDFLCQFGMDA